MPLLGLGILIGILFLFVAIAAVLGGVYAFAMARQRRASPLQGAAFEVLALHPADPPHEADDANAELADARPASGRWFSLSAEITPGPPWLPGRRFWSPAEVDLGIPDRADFAIERYVRIRGLFDGDRWTAFDDPAAGDDALDALFCATPGSPDPGSEHGDDVIPQAARIEILFFAPAWVRQVQAAYGPVQLGGPVAIPEPHGR
jgi:hypothetical protein